MTKAAATASKAKTPPNRLSQLGNTSYNFVERDPVMDDLCRIILESGWSVERIESETTKIGRKVSRYTLLGWLYKVRRPQNYGIDSVCMVLGIYRPFIHAGNGTKVEIPRIDLKTAKFVRDPTLLAAPETPKVLETPKEAPMPLVPPKAQKVVQVKTATAKASSTPKPKARAKAKASEIA